MEGTKEYPIVESSRRVAAVSRRPIVALWLGHILAVLLFASGCGDGGNDPLGDMSRAKALGSVGSLGEEITFQGFRFRPPEYLAKRDMASPAPSVSVAAWTKPELGNKPGPSIFLACGPNNLDLTKQAPQWQHISQAMLAGFRRHFRKVNQVDGRRIKVNGLQAYRAEFTAETPDSQPLAGVALVIVDEQNALAAIMIDVGENAAATVTTMEESLMTIHRPGHQPRENLLWDAPPGTSASVPLPAKHLEMIEKFGQDRIAFIKVVDPPSRRDMEKAFLEAAGPDSLIYGHNRVDEYWIHLAPVDDVKTFADNLTIGTASSIDEDERSFIFRADPEQFPPVEKAAPRTAADMASHYGEAFPEMPSRKAPVTSPDDPNFFSRNLEDLRSSNGFDSEKALKRLADVDTSKLTDAAMRKDIAQAIRAVAFDSSEMPNTRIVAIKGLVHWGGKYAGPLLVQLLREDEPFIEDEIYRQLAVLKEPTAIDLLVEKLMEMGRSSEKAGKCLIAYGPVAEDSILANTRAENFMVTRNIVQVLAEIGTKKSLSALKSLRRLPFYNMISGDVQRAIQMIEQREKQAK